jgi:flagellar motor switch protein FliM
MLTQAEIDALLSGAIAIEGKDGGADVNLAEIMGGGAPITSREQPDSTAKKVTAYNFWSPDRFSKEQMRAVELVYEDLAEKLTTSIPTFLRTNLKPRLVHTEQGRFHDFLKDLPPNALFHMITLAPLPGYMVVTISPNVSYLVLEQRLGGKIEGEAKERPLTDIDQSLLRGLVEHMLNDLKSAWSKLVPLEPSLEDSTVNQHWVQMVMGNEKVMLLTFELTIQGTTGTMNVYLPFGTLKPISGVLNPHIWISGRKEKVIDNSSRDIAMKSLNNVQLPVQVMMGSVDLELGEVMNLQAGDVIQLDTKVNEPLVMQVANQRLFKVFIGKVGSQMAVQVSSTMQEDHNANGFLNEVIV